MAWTNPRTWVAGEVVTAALLNAHLRDNLLAIGNPTHTAFTPSVANLPVHPTFSFHRYYRSGNLIVGEFYMEATGAGTGTFDLNLPVAARTSVGFRGIGQALLVDSATGFTPSTMFIISTTTARFMANGTGAVANTTTPFTWGSGDTISGSYSYEAA